MDGQSACFVYKRTDCDCFGCLKGEGGGGKQRPHTVCVIMPLGLANIARCYNIQNLLRQSQISPTSSIS